MSAGNILSTLSEDYEQYLSDSEHGPLNNSIQLGGHGGSFGNISESDYENLLLFNENLPMFHELPLRALIHLPSLITKLGIVQVTHDHYHYWAWTAESLVRTNRDGNYLQDDIERLFLLTVDFAVGKLTRVPVSEKIFEENKQMNELSSPHAKRAMINSHRAATQLCHPLLEGLLRRLCSDYVELDGMIKSGKKILKMDGEEKESGRVNNVGDLLHHYENRVAGDEIADALESIRYAISQYSKTSSGYDIINSWRHPHSHGGERLSGSEHVVLLNIACLLVWQSVPRQKYEGIDKSRYDRNILETSKASSLNHSDYYPLKETRHLLSESSRFV